MAILSPRVVRNSSDNLEIGIAGCVADDETINEVIVHPADFECKSIRISAIFHSIQDGLCLLFYWEGEDDHALAMPLEGRGVLDLVRFGGLENSRHPGWTGKLLLKTERSKPGLKHFAVTLEMTKVRS